jgi:predicted  nucleic acid-binding Zn-ribbon protein
MLADVELLVQLQGLDLRAEELRKAIAARPQEIAGIERTLVAHLKKLEADRLQCSNKQKERKQVDAEAQVQMQKIAKLKDQMTGSKISNEQFHAFQKEVAFHEEAIKRCEDRALELMAELEGLEGIVKLSEANLRTEKKAVDARRDEAKRATEEEQARLAALLEERKALAAQLSREAAGQYERLSRRYPGSVIADATNGQCGGCNLGLRPQLFQDLRKREKLLICENCKRLLYYNPAVVVDPPPPPAPPAPKARASSARASGTRSSPPSAGGTRVDMT